MLMYLILTTVFFLLGGLIWNYKDPLNFLIKFALFGMGVWSLYLLIKH